MPQIIACLSQKGGVGKSTLARLIAWAYATGDWNVKIADFNTRQLTSVDWVAARNQANMLPRIGAEAFTTVRPLGRDKAALIVADGRPDSDQTSLEIARVANLIVIPTGTSIDDVKPQLLFANELREKGIPANRLLFVINKTTESQLATDEARASIEGLGYDVARTDLSAKTGYQMAQNIGKAVTETVFQSLNDRAERLAAEIVERMTVATQERV